MLPSQHKPRIGLLALTLELYEQLAPGLRAARERWLRESVLPRLAPWADVHFTCATYRPEQVASIVADCERQDCDGLLVMCLTYAPSQMVMPALARTRLPIVLWNTQALAAVDASYDADQMLHNHGVHGTQDLANVLVRGGVPFHHVTSHLDDAEALDELADWFAAAQAVAALRRARLGLIGYPFPGMGDFAVDTTHLATTIGCRWDAISVAEYNRRAAEASETAVRDTVAEYQRMYAVADDVSVGDLEATARAELALRALVTERRLQALSYQFLAFGDDDRSETLPFVGISRLMAEGLGFAGEGDLIGAAGTFLLNQLCPPASFSEIFTIDFRGNGLLLSHMGEANAAMVRPDRRLALVARPTPITRTRARQLALVTTFAPGPATLCALALGPAGRWRLIASQVEIADFGPLSLPVPHTKIITSSDVRAWLTDYAQAGGPHHHALALGDARPRLQIAARLLGADYFEIC
jgi:L-arabinose isomerase